MNCKIKKKSGKPGARILAVFLLTALLLSFAPYGLTGQAEYDSNTFAISDKAGSIAAIPEDLEQGQIWTGKSVDFVTENDDKFEITLSALGQQYKVENEENKPVNVVFVLDVSSSMLDKGNNRNDNKINKAITALNAAAAQIRAQNSNNRIGVVTFAAVANVLVDLNSQDINLKYESNGTYGRVKNLVTNKVNSLEQGTNIQFGLNKAYHMLNDADNKNSAKPIIILLSDGHANHHRTDVDKIPVNSSKSDWNQNLFSNGVTEAAWILRQAEQLKKQMNKLLIYTIGYDIGSDNAAKASLDPSRANITALWNNTGFKNILGTSSVDDAVKKYNYPVKYYSSKIDDNDLSEIFSNIIKEISYPSPLKSSSELVITDTVSDDFKLLGDLVVSLDRNLNGVVESSEKYILTGSGGVYSTTALPGLTVEITETDNGGEITRLLRWTIPADLLPVNEYDTSGSTPVLIKKLPISLKFTVDLNNKGEGTYYTNYNNKSEYDNRGSNPGAFSTIEPAIGNPYYYEAAGGNDDGFVPKSGRGLGADGVASIPMDNTGKITLVCDAGTLSFGKVVAAYDGVKKGPVTSFMFDISISGYTGTGTIYNGDGTTAGTFNINNGNAQISLADRQYAEIENIKKKIKSKIVCKFLSYYRPEHCHLDYPARRSPVKGKGYASASRTLDWMPDFAGDSC